MKKSETESQESNKSNFLIKIQIQPFEKRVESYQMVGAAFQIIKN